MSGGIYKIVNLRNNKVYIGSAKNLNERKDRHFADLSKNTHRNKHLQRAFNLYGESIFEFTVLEKLGDYNKEIYFSNEDKWMAVYDSRNPELGYNIAAASGGGHLGCKHTKETKKKISQSMLKDHPTKGRPLSEEHKSKISKSNLGKIISEESKEKNRQWQLEHNPRRGKKCSEEHKSKISKANSGKNHWNFGKEASPAQKESARKLFTENNPNATKVSIDGVTYISQAEACRKFGISKKVMYNRLKSDKPEWEFWYKVEN